MTGKCFEKLVKDLGPAETVDGPRLDSDRIQESEAFIKCKCGHVRDCLKSALEKADNGGFFPVLSKPIFFGNTAVLPM